MARISNTADWATPSTAAILDLASRLDSVAIGRARKSIAGLLGVPLGSLDDKLGELVKKRVDAGGAERRRPARQASHVR